MPIKLGTGDRIGLVIFAFFAIIVLLAIITPSTSRTTTTDSTINEIVSTKTIMPTSSPTYTAQSVLTGIDGYAFKKQISDGKEYYVANSESNKNIIVKAWGKPDYFKSVEISFIAMDGISQDELQSASIVEVALFNNLTSSIDQLNWITGTRENIGKKKYDEKTFGDRKISMIVEKQNKGGWKKQRDLLGVFAQTVFGIVLDDSKQTFNLELLKGENFAIVSDPEDQMEWWRLKMVELSTPDRISRIRLVVSDESRAGTFALWNLLRQLNLADKMHQMIINSADIQMKFKPNRKYQKGLVTFNISWKDRCTLNSIDETHLRARALLKKSKLDYGFTQKTSE